MSLSERDIIQSIVHKVDKQYGARFVEYNGEYTAERKDSEKPKLTFELCNKYRECVFDYYCSQNWPIDNQQIITVANTLFMCYMKAKPAVDWYKRHNLFTYDGVSHCNNSQSV